MFELIGTLLGGIFSGGATGLIGVALQRFADFKNKQLDMQLEKQRGELRLLEKDKDLAIMQGEWAGRLRVAETEGAAAQEVAATQAFGASLLKEPERYSNAATLSTNQQWLMVLLDAIRGGVRPLLTVYLCVLTTYIWFQVRGMVSSENLDAQAALDVWKMVVAQILYLTTTVVLWWFGTRNKQEQPPVRR